MDNNQRIIEVPYLSYYGRKYILTKTELAFYEVLKEVIGNDNIIFPKVRMEDLVRAKDNYSKERNRNRIKSRHVDFAIFNKESLMIRLVIELDDPSHDNYKAKQVDRFKDEVFANCGIKIARIFCQNQYDKETLKEQLKTAYNAQYKIVYNKSSVDRHNSDWDMASDWTWDNIVKVFRNLFKV